VRNAPAKRATTESSGRGERVTAHQQLSSAVARSGGLSFSVWCWQASTDSTRSEIGDQSLCNWKLSRRWIPQANAQVQLQARYNHCGEGASESAFQLQRPAATSVRWRSMTSYAASAQSPNRALPDAGNQSESHSLHVCRVPHQLIPENILLQLHAQHHERQRQHGAQGSEVGTEP
jgi:hypothetical protein